MVAPPVRAPDATMTPLPSTAASGEVRKQVSAPLIVADLAHHRERCAKCRRGSCLVAALPAAADGGRAGGDHRFPWRWPVINQKREVGVLAADDSEPGHLTAIGRICQS